MLVHGLAIATAIATYLLILIGGLVHGTGSSLACPDWPTCYGTMMPVMEGGVLVEHSHRLAAGTVVLLTLVLATVTTLSRDPAHRPLRRVAWLAVTLVFIQALLGGITVKLRLPTPVSTAHTATSLLFFMTTLYLAVRSRPAARQPAAPAGSMPREVALGVSVALVTAVCVYFQMVLGGLVRHSGAALACTDLPLCRGSVWPDAHPTVLIHVMHRINALVVAGLVLASSIVTFRQARGRAGLRALAVIAPVLVGVQIALGVLAIVSFLDLVTVESHLAVATALLATQVGVVLLGRRVELVAAPPIRARFIVDLIRLTKPRITALVVATFAGGVWLAPGGMARWRLVMTLIGTALVVSASNAINMFLERDQDRLMDRTRARPLPEGRLSPEAALVFGSALACASLPLQASERATRVYILLFSIGLVAATILLEPLRVAGMRYMAAAAVLGATLIGWGLVGFRRAVAVRPWARSLFFFSLVYLTLLFVALIMDRTFA